VPIEKEIQGVKRKALNYLKSAQRTFKELKLNVSQARSILINANFLSETSGDDKAKLQNCLSDLIFAQKVFEENLYFQHHVECLIFIS
jgi:hypothetical protein